MKIRLGVAMTAVLLLTACAPKPPAADPNQTAAADQAPVAKKKKCGDQTGSRLAPCGEGSTGDWVQGEGGDAYRDASMHSAPLKNPN